MDLILEQSSERSSQTLAVDGNQLVSVNHLRGPIKTSFIDWYRAWGGRGAYAKSFLSNSRMHGRIHPILLSHSKPAIKFPSHLSLITKREDQFHHCQAENCDTYPSLLHVPIDFFDFSSTFPSSGQCSSNLFAGTHAWTTIEANVNMPFVTINTYAQSASALLVLQRPVLKGIYHPVLGLFPVLEALRKLNLDFFVSYLCNYPGVLFVKSVLVTVE